MYKNELRRLKRDNTGDQYHSCITYPTLPRANIGRKMRMQHWLPKRRRPFLMGTRRSLLRHGTMLGSPCTQGHRIRNRHGVQTSIWGIMMMGWIVKSNSIGRRRMQSWSSQNTRRNHGRHWIELSFIEYVRMVGGGLAHCRLGCLQGYVVRHCWSKRRTGRRRRLRLACSKVRLLFGEARQS
jgi:hypothetical protein